MLVWKVGCWATVVDVAAASVGTTCRAGDGPIGLEWMLISWLMAVGEVDNLADLELGGIDTRIGGPDSFE